MAKSDDIPASITFAVLGGLGLATLYVVFGWPHSPAPTSTQSAASGFRGFDVEAKRVSAAIHCPNPKVTPAGDGMGALYGCILGSAETAKFWINEVPSRPGTIENMKVMWNDWTRDVGYGAHADNPEATRMVSALAQLYAPELEADLLAAFRGAQARQFSSGPYVVEYRLTPGPAIDEHLLSLSQR